MAHNITKRDRQDGIKQAWHQLTNVVDNIDIDNCFLTEWEIEKQPVFIPIQGEMVETTFQVLIGSDDGQVIGKPFDKTYKPISNSMFLSLVKEIISKVNGIKIESVGSVCNRGRVFVSASIKEHEKTVIGKREFHNFINFGTSHDQSTKLWVNNSNICTVCDNTFTFNMNGGRHIASAVHRGDVELKLQNVDIVVKDFLGAQSDFEERFTKLTGIGITEEDVRPLYAGFITRNSFNPGLVNSINQKTENLTSLFFNGRGNSGKDLADAFSAVTDYYTHNSTRKGGENKERQFVSSEFGIGSIHKRAFWEIVNDENILDRTVERGKTTIKMFA